MTIQYDPHRAPGVPVLGEAPPSSFDAGFSRVVGGSIYRNVVKRVLDVVLVLLTAPVILAVLLVLVPLVALDGGNPFYSQLRVGKNGRLYRMWKLRTMVCDADARLESYLAANPEARREWDKDQKLKEDPRVTRVGGMLRRASLDELPQFLNVLLGDMSLVGPRPMMVSQQELYPGRAYYRLLPGITGTWQVTDRNNSTFADRARYDAEYERELSFMTDMRVLLATVRVVVRGTGY
jgi:exopolysaccharide production protein ExoY